MAQFSTNESVSLEKSIDFTKRLIETSSNDIDNVYELEKCMKWIKENDYKKVCLQFPDYLLPDSCEIASRLQKRLEQVVYIIGDSAYESCCVDYVTAQHVDSDAIIHFGPRCLSTWTNVIPCLCIYDKVKIDPNQFSICFAKKFQNVEQYINIILDTPYLHIQEKMEQLLTKHDYVKVYNVDEISFKINDTTILYVGQNNRKLLNFQLKHQVKELYYYDAEEQCPAIKDYIENNVIIKRRRYLIEKIKDSQTVGIIIGTVVVQNFIKAIDRIKKLLKSRNKKYYVISVGRPTVAKLANFPEMDVYVLICCSMSDVFDSRDFLKPIVTPFDIEMALNPKATDISFSYELDLKYLEEEIVEVDIHQPDVSLLTGNIRFEECVQDEFVHSKDLAIKDKGTLALSDKSGAGFLATRAFKGLEQNLGQTDVRLAKEGRKGIPQQYENEFF